MPRVLVLAAVLALPALPLHAQEAGERAQRAADNPFRMIIEAAKIKPRKPGEKPAPRAAAGATPAATAPAGAASAPPAPPAPALAARPPLPRSDAEPPPPETAEAAAPVPLVVLEPAAREQPESTVVTVEAAPVTLPVASAEPEPEAAPAAPAPLRLMEVVEPVTPRALLGQLRGEVRAQVAFTVAPDGAVRAARVETISHPLMTSSVLQAVRQWRYQPIPEPRAHEVEIVLRQN